MYIGKPTMKFEILDKLPTRDGREYGNAVVVGCGAVTRLARNDSVFYELLIDDKTVIMSEEDIKAHFYPVNGKVDKLDVEPKLNPRHVVLRRSTCTTGHGTSEVCFEVVLDGNGELPTYSLKTAEKLAKYADYRAVKVVLGKEIPEGQDKPVGL